MDGSRLSAFIPAKLRCGATFVLVLRLSAGLAFCFKWSGCHRVSLLQRLLEQSYSVHDYIGNGVVDVLAKHAAGCARLPSSKVHEGSRMFKRVMAVAMRAIAVHAHIC
eukprot:2681380-Lingulodinium_polyedra.AAC.1